MHATYACAASIFLWAVAATTKPGGGGLPIADVPALSDDGLANLVAFTRGFGLVRFFHPSDEASSARWEELAVMGVERLQTARSSSELAAGLSALFEPVAPTARFQLATVPVPRLTAPAGAAQVVRWRHHA